MGDLEMDTIIGANGHEAILTLVDSQCQVLERSLGGYSTCSINPSRPKLNLYKKSPEGIYPIDTLGAFL